MSASLSPVTFQYRSQRAVSSYLKSQAPFTCVLPPDLGTLSAAEMESSQRDLHAFFQALYAQLFAEPALFGLPLDPDSFITEGDDSTDRKAEVNRQLERSRRLLERGLAYLQLTGLQGRLSGQALLLENFPALLKESGIDRKFLAGLARVGLDVVPSGTVATLTNSQFPGLFPALQTLAQGCARYTPAGVGQVHFARCDFQALRINYVPSALDLYRMFDPEDFDRLADLHAFFIGLGYKAQVGYGRMFAWEVKYQSRREVKGTPLFQVEYQERYATPLRLWIKCASTRRLAPILPGQPAALQADFIKRLNLCQGCDWCKNRTNLGPVEIEVDGVRRKVCWYANPGLPGLTEDTVALVRQYAFLHEQLLPLA